MKSVIRFRRDERAAFNQVSYSLALGITILLMSGLLTATGSFVNNTNEDAATVQLQTIGDRLAAKLMAVDKQAQHDDDLTVTLETEVPKTVAGSYYMIKIETNTNGKGDYLLLYSVSDAASVKIPLDLETSVSEATVESDEDLVIEREGGTINLESED